jgi:hypothetical protein
MFRRSILLESSYLKTTGSKHLARNKELRTYLFGLDFDPEDGRNNFLRNLCKNPPEYRASYPRRQYSTKLYVG